MTVYVDDVRHGFGRMIMCHLWADTEEELLEMVDKIGVQRKWIQGHPTLSFGKHRNASWVHFDISLGRKKKALELGAVLTDKFGPLEHTAKLDIASGDPDRIVRGKKKLEQIEACRAVG
jgi:hypothetical protein